MRRFEKRISMFRDKHIKAFEKSLAFSDDQILEEFSLTLDGRVLTEEEAKRFIVFIRAERFIK